MSSDTKNKIQKLYTQFFQENELDIHVESGVLRSKAGKIRKLKFATYPYIGNQYGGNRKNTKTLFIGLDVGKDERPGYITSFSERQEDIGNDLNYNDVKYNPHIAGTLVTASHFNNKKVLEKIKNTKNYKDAIGVLKGMGIKNPLAYITLTNFYKFVTQKRNNRSGFENRKYICKKLEQKLLFSEIEIFNPKIVIFQSVEFLHSKYKDFFNKLKNKNETMEIYIGPHPACRPPYSRTPKRYLSYIKLIDKIKW